jgi:hypothetical protein
MVAITLLEFVAALGSYPYRAVRDRISAVAEAGI